MLSFWCLGRGLNPQRINPLDFESSVSANCTTKALWRTLKDLNLRPTGSEPVTLSPELRVLPNISCTECFQNGVPLRIWTLNRLVRSQVLYPIELRELFFSLFESVSVKRKPLEKGLRIGASWGTRNPDPRFRRPLLYPTELKTQIGGKGKIRTCDTRIFNPLLYQLSYNPIAGFHDLDATLFSFRFKKTCKSPHFRKAPAA